MWIVEEQNHGGQGTKETEMATEAEALLEAVQTVWRTGRTAMVLCPDRSDRYLVQYWGQHGVLVESMKETK